MDLLTVSALLAASSGLTADSILAMISVAGSLVGVTAKFRPFFSKDTSASLRVLDDKLITQVVLSTKVVGETEDCFSRKSFSGLALLTVFCGIKDSLNSGFNLVEYRCSVIRRKSRCYALFCGFGFFLRISLGSLR